MGLESLLAGRVLADRYRIDHVVGRGGMGAVYSASDLRLDRTVAVKVITADTADVAARARLRARFHREARAAARLQHPHVVTVHDYGTDPQLDMDFLVMELLRGEDVARRLQRGSPPELATALEIVEQAARGVAAGHRVGLIHRDIKPGNLFLVDEGAERLRVSVLDFGIVQLSAEDENEATATHLTVAGRAPHSPAYAAPEQLRGEGDLTAAVDVWGLGATAFQILTGERPFTEPQLRRMMDGMSVPAPSVRVRNPRVPEAVDDVLRIALACRPADRFRDATAFANAIADARRGVAPRAVGATAAPPRPAPARAEEDDHTLLDPGYRPQPQPAPRPEPRWQATPPRRPADATHDGTLLDPARADLERGPSSIARPGGSAQFRQPPVPAGSPADLARPGRPRGAVWMQRAMATLWQMTLTVAAAVTAGAFGAAMFEAFYNDLREPFWAAVVGFTATLPWAVHRLLGRRGSYVLALLGCILVAVAVFRFMTPLTGPEPALWTLIPAQVLLAVWIARLTRRRELGVEG
jgi:eukaryotic-like serine/threonine-protein kinase